MAAAQAAPALDSGQLLQQQRSSPEALPPRLPPSEEPAALPAAPSTGNAEEAGGVQVKIQAIRFAGAEGLATDAELQAQVADALESSLGMAQLEQLAERVTQFLKGQGWMLARAYLPPQDVTSGRLLIEVKPGFVEGDRQGSGFKIDGDVQRIDGERLRRTLATALFRGDEDVSLHSQRLERGVLLLNDLAGIQARSTLEKGSTPGATQVGLQITEGPRWGASVMLDNQGNRYTGKERATAQFYLNNPSGAGDQITSSMAIAPNLGLATLGYSRPLGYDGVIARFLHTRMNYRMGEEMAASQSKGDATTYSAELSWPLLRSRPLNLRLQTNIEHKALRDETMGVLQKDRRVDSFGLGANGDSLDGWLGGGMFNFWLNNTWGEADYSRVESDVRGDATAQTGGAFYKLQTGLVRTQRLSEQWSVFASLTAQFADGNLPSSEKFALGGPSGVRAYAGGEGSGDEGRLLSLELRYDLPASAPGRQLQWIGFIDAGQVTLNKHPWANSAGNAANSNQYDLAGAGLGINYSKSGAYSLKAVWARRIGENPGRAAGTGLDSDGKKVTDRFWLMTTFMF